MRQSREEAERHEDEDSEKKKVVKKRKNDKNGGLSSSLEKKACFEKETFDLPQSYYRKKGKTPSKSLTVEEERKVDYDSTEDEVLDSTGLAQGSLPPVCAEEEAAAAFVIIVNEQVPEGPIALKAAPGTSLNLDVESVIGKHSETSIAAATPSVDAKKNDDEQVAPKQLSPLLEKLKRQQKEKKEAVAIEAAMAAVADTSREEGEEEVETGYEAKEEDCDGDEGSDNSLPLNIDEEGEDKPLSNPFAQFNFGGAPLTQDTLTRGEASSSFKKSSSSSLSISSGASSSSSVPQLSSILPLNDHKSKKKPYPKLKDNPDVPLLQWSDSDKAKVMSKWQSFPPCQDDIETRRFQMLVAARLHAQCQEPVIRNVMTTLEQGLEDHGGFNIQTISVMDESADLLCELCSSVHFYRSKCQQIVEAAKQCVSKFGGKVPVVKKELGSLKGIGKKFEELLEYVNSVEGHEEHLASKRKKGGEQQLATIESTSATTVGVGVDGQADIGESEVTHSSLSVSSANAANDADESNSLHFQKKRSAD